MTTNTMFQKVATFLHIERYQNQSENSPSTTTKPKTTVLQRTSIFLQNEKIDCGKFNNMDYERKSGIKIGNAFFLEIINISLNRRSFIGTQHYLESVHFGFLVSRNGIIKIMQFLFAYVLYGLLYDFFVTQQVDTYRLIDYYMILTSACKIIIPVQLVCYMISSPSYYRIRETLFVSTGVASIELLDVVLIVFQLQETIFNIFCFILYIHIASQGIILQIKSSNFLQTETSTTQNETAKPMKILKHLFMEVSSCFPRGNI